MIKRKSTVCIFLTILSVNIKLIQTRILLLYIEDKKVLRALLEAFMKS